ncbi:MAG TPA: ABC transporter permease [Solirubrobacteraceae bacterium]|nr:ABC transporter permease [Solirubrobacteraceae bacterium]
MTGFVLRRVAQAAVVLLGVTLVVFILERLTPGSLAHAVLGPRASPQAVAAFNATNGLNHPVVVQYLEFLGHLARGNLGYSYRLNQSVGSLVAHEAPNDLILVGLGLVFALAIAVPLGIAQAVHRNRAVDHVATGAALALYSMPSYWLALLLIGGLSIGAHVLPPEAGQSGATAGILADPRGLVLPVLTLTLVNVAWFSRYMRSAAIDTLAQDYVRLARAKGLPERLVLSRHVLRNSLLAIVTLVGMSVPMLLTSGLVVEYVFNVPGVGLSYYEAAANADYPVELGVTVIVGLATVLGSLLADVSYAVLDPRVRQLRSGHPRPHSGRRHRRSGGHRRRPGGHRRRPEGRDPLSGPR